MPNENEIGPYRLARDGITLSKVGDDGRIHTYKKGDKVYISGRKAKEIGAERIEDQSEKDDGKEVIKTFRQVIENPPKEEEKIASGSTSLDLSSLSHLTFDKAVELISQITSSSDIQLAKDIEMRGKRRKSVLEAIEARGKEVKP